MAGGWTKASNKTSENPLSTTLYHWTTENIVIAPKSFYIQSYGVFFDIAIKTNRWLFFANAADV